MINNKQRAFRLYSVAFAVNLKAFQLIILYQTLPTLMWHFNCFFFSFWH